MSLEFLNFQSMAVNQNANTGVFARFYDKPVKTGRVLTSGLPEFEQKLYIEIKIKDERDVFDQPASEDHIRRFAKEYQRYLNQKEQKKEGTSLELFAFLTPEQIECCHLRQIFSIEELSETKEDLARDLGLKEEKELAERFLKMSQNNQIIAEWHQKEKKYLEQIKALTEEVEKLRKNDRL